MPCFVGSLWLDSQHPLGPKFALGQRGKLASEGLAHLGLREGEHMYDACESEEKQGKMLQQVCFTTNDN